MRTLPSSLLLLSALALAACAPSQNGTVACTMEAKECPDGSFVGREGPKCEFAACPVATSSGASAHSVSDGAITFSYPLPAFGLAVTGEQMPTSYIPACEENFTYCAYFAGQDYAGTNFDSAGLGIVKRTDLTDAACLTAQPAGYTGLKPVTRQGEGYTTSVFAPLGDAGAGHYAHDRLYRLSFTGSCYELRTRIGASQFANYEAGTIKEFKVSDEAVLQTKLNGILGGVTLKNGTKVVFPEPPAAK